MQNNFISNKKTLLTTAITIIVLVVVLIFIGYQIGLKKGLTIKKSIINKYSNLQDSDSETPPPKTSDYSALTNPPIKANIIDLDQAELDELIRSEKKGGNLTKNSDKTKLNATQIRRELINNGVPTKDLDRLTDEQIIDFYYQ